MFRTLLLLVATGSVAAVCGQGVGINNPTPHASALLDLTSTDRGLLIPRMTSVERDAIISPASSLMIFNTTTTRFEYFSGSAWTPLAATGTLDQAYDFGGTGTGRTITADGGAVTIAGSDGLVSTGSLNTGSVAPVGAGVRMVWNPRKAAFRAGTINIGTHWDDANIGPASTAFGMDTRASGSSSMAWGNFSVASGLSSTAWGNSSVATGVSSTAWGSSTAAGPFGTAWGTASVASGSASTAWGLGSVIASGSGSTASGIGTEARSFCEIAVGMNNTLYSPSSSTTSSANDRLFVIGNGTSSSSRSDAMVVLKNGNTGFGSSTPQDRLHVVGNIRMVDGNQAANKVLTSDAIGRGSWQVPKQPNHHVVVGTLPSVIGTTVNPLAQMSITFTPNHPIAIVHFSGGTPNGTVNCNTMVEFQLVVNSSIVTTIPTGVTGEGGLSADILGYDAAFTYPIAVTPGVPTTVQINARSTNCNVPISANRSLVVIDPNGTGLTTTTGTPPSTGSWDVMGNAGTNSNVNFIGTTDGQPLVLRTNNIERLRVNSNGKVDLGLAGIPFMNLSPLSSGRLQVASVGEINQTLVHASASPSNLSLVFARARGTLSAFTDVAVNDVLGEMGFYGYRNSMQPGASISSSVETITAGSFGADLRFGTSQPGELVASPKMVITSIGNVGIGTTAPNQRLHVAGRSLFQNGFSADNAALLYRDNTDYMFLGPQSGSSTNGGAIALYGSTNAVGGNANGMDVNVPGGRVRFNQTNAQFEFRSNSTSGYTAALELTDIGLQVGHNSASRAIQFMNAGGERMRIAANGNVGIAMPAPATALHVVGSITAASTFVSVTSNAFNYAPGNQTYVQMQSNGSAGLRQVILGSGLAPGQLLIIQCTALFGNGISFLDGGNMAVGGGLSRSLDADDTITFIWSGTKWVEIAYSSN
ncbi:MAG: hypothetical protein JNN32_11975 [Flavobacteriales bacterium]|nr:hypothetical protein [Flavobacteriales bacterium]